MNHMIDRLTIHDCGGTILTAGSGEQEHTYCDRCRAFVYASCDDQDMPTGTALVENRAAWDDGEERSPEANN